MIRSVLPGIWISVIVGLAALFLSEHYGAPAMLFALLLGIALSFVYEETSCKAGIEFTACHILRIGVALLGLRIALSDLTVLGWQTAVLLLLAILSTLLVGSILAKWMGLPARFGVLTGGAVGICGASAAMAISAVLPKNAETERDTLLTIIGVTSLSTIAMVIYPMIAGFLELDATATSIFLGGTIHDVAQVVGAGYSVSDQTGDLATLTKLVRVAFLMPVVIAIILVFRAQIKRQSASSKIHDASFAVPGFLIAFVVLVIVNSSVDLPTSITQAASEFSRFALVVAIGAIGMKSNLRQLLTVGAKPILILVGETVWIAGFILVGLKAL